jgi:O-antigen/teichoic acid export membrane protein
VLVVANGPLTTFLNAGGLGFWLMLTPLALFLTALAAALRYYANRHKNYSLISRMIVAQTLFASALSISVGLGGFEATGLLFAALSGLLFGSGYLVYAYREPLRAISWRFDRSIWRLAQRYKQFPLYSAFPSFLDGLTLALPVFFLTKYFPEAIVGYYALLTRVATAPLAFVAQAVSQVHLKKVAELVHQQQRATRYLIHITFVLSGIVALPTIVLMLYAPTLFAWIFGPQWQQAGELLVILMPALALRFVVSTVSGALLSTGNSHLGAFWQVTAFIITFVMFTIFTKRLLVTDLFFVMMLTDVLLYLFYYGLIWFAVKRPKALG